MTRGDHRVSRGAALFALCTASFLQPFMLSAVGVALPPLGRDLGASATQLGLVETTYTASMAIFMLAMGRLGDIHGRRRIFQTGIALFTLMGGGLSLAWSMEGVIVLRFLQGVGAAMFSATSTAIVTSVFPAEERGKALGIWVASVYTGLSCGPFIGGILVTAFGWRAVFYACVPLGATVFFLVQRKIRGEWADARGEPFDWRGSSVYAGAVVLFVVGASSLEVGPWAWGVLGAGVAGLAAFVALEGRTRYPILDVGLLRSNRVFTFSNLAALLNYGATFGVTFFLSLYLQYVKGMTPQQAGTVLVAQPLAQAVLSPVCGRLADRYPAERVATLGMALCAVGLGIAATISAATPLPVLIAMLLFLGTGFALFSSPNTSVIMGSVEPRQYGVASGLVSTVRTLGMMTSMIVITLVLSAFMGRHAVTAETQPLFLRSMRFALVTYGVLCLLGIGCSLVRLRPGAAEAGRA